MSDVEAHESLPAGASRPVFQARLRILAMVLLVLGALAGAWAGVFLYIGATAIEMGGIATIFGIGLAIIAVVLLSAGGIAALIGAAIKWRNARH